MAYKIMPSVHHVSPKVPKYARAKPADSPRAQDFELYGRPGLRNSAKWGIRRILTTRWSTKSKKANMLNCNGWLAGCSSWLISINNITIVCVHIQYHSCVFVLFAKYHKCVYSSRNTTGGVGVLFSKYNRTGQVCVYYPRNITGLSVLFAKCSKCVYYL